jgi:predicted dehydrogenase
VGDRTRYAIVGTGGRALMYVDAICDTYAASNELVALCDNSHVRMAFHNDRLVHKYGGEPRAVYGDADFDRMVAEQRPDVVIVTTVDAFHDVYIVRAMELGCDVLTEKPMTTTAAKAARIFDAIERTGRSLRVGFNYRYAPAFTALRRVIADGEIGAPQLVAFNWMLDTSHGADYFRRWHREKDSSGGLLVHKATHHFDLVNWWIDSWPATVFALGDLRFYGRANAERRGHAVEYSRYTGVEAAADDPFRFDLTWHRALQGLYLDAEEETGYLRDRNVFGDDISIEDAMTVTARYRSGALLSYSLVAFSPWEGLEVAITGDKGRVELVERDGTPTVTLHPMFGQARPVEWTDVEGDHGGGDALMLEQLFAPDPPPDPYGWAASHLDGAASIVTGISANQSIDTGLPVTCADVIPLP